MSGETSTGGKAGSRRSAHRAAGHGEKAPPEEKRKPSAIAKRSPIKATQMAKKAPAATRKPALRPVPVGVTNAVHGGTPAKPRKPRAKAPIPAGTTIITHGTRLKKPTKPPAHPLPGPATHNVGPALAAPPKPKAKKAKTASTIVYVPPEYHDAGASPFTYVGGNVKWPGHKPRQAGDVGTYEIMRSITSPQQMKAAHTATPPKGVTLASPFAPFAPHSHKFVTPSRFVDPFFSDQPFPYDPETVGVNTPLPKGYREMQEKLNAIAFANAMANFFTGAGDFQWFQYPADTEVKP
jgi:hypothetical protein